MLSRNREWCNKIIYNVTIYKTLKWTELTTLKLPLSTETLIWINIVGSVGGSLLRCNYYHEYLACEEEDFCERYILVEGDWELLSGERLVILLKIAQLQLNDTWETKPVPKYESSCFRKEIDVISDLCSNYVKNILEIIIRARSLVVYFQSSC